MGMPGVGSFGDIGTDTALANTVVVKQASPKTLNDSLYRTIYSGTQSELVDFLERPQAIVTGVFQNTDLATTFPKYKVMDSLLSSPLLLAKILGKYSLKADVRLRLQVNASRFQQGRYILAWIPSGGDNGASAGDNFNLFHAHSTCQVTQLPHVEFDLACDTEVELVIPFTAYFMAVGNVNAGTVSMDTGVFFLYPYQALSAVAGSLSAPYTLWANFENISFFGSAIPQSGMKMQTKKGKKSVAQQEAISAGKGPISTVLNGVASFAGTLSLIPMLTEIAAPVSWVAGILGQTAAAFGWSKPSDESSAMRVVRTPQPFFSNVDVCDPGLKLSMSISNSIDVLPGFAGTDIDEMSIDYIKSIPAFFNRISWGSASAVGTALCNYKVGPQYLGYTEVPLGGGLVTNFPPVGYLANGFAYWRGSLKFTLKFVKTEFHSGRLLVSFNPINTAYVGGVGPTVIANSNYVIREIFDVRRGNEFTVTVPYVNYENWSNVRGPNGFIGYLSAIVLDPLIAPNTVSSTINILVEVSGGDDFELACPNGDSAGHNLIQMTTFQSSMQMQNISEPCEVSDIVLGGSTSMDAETLVAPSFSCIGEKILSLRQYLKRFSPAIVFSGTAGSTFLSGDGLATSYTIGPLMDINVDAATNKPPTYTADPFTYFGAMYGMFRGSIRYRLTNFDESDSGTLVVACNTGQGSSNTYKGIAHPGILGISSVVRNSGFDNQAIGTVSSNAGIEVTVPFYNRNHSLPVRGLLICGSVSTVSNTNISGLAFDSPEAPRNTMYVGLSSANGGYCLYRAIGEDASFGRFISTPVIAGNQLFT